MPPQTIPASTFDGQVAEAEVEQLRWRPGVYAVILNGAGQVLVLDSLLSFKYEFPGGGIELWETIPQALTREVWEETGLDVRVGRFLHADEAFLVPPNGRHIHALRYFYAAHVEGGELRETIIEGELSINPHWLDIGQLTVSNLYSGWEALQIALRM